MAKFYPRMKSLPDRLLRKYGTSYSVTREGTTTVINGKEVTEPDKALKPDPVGIKVDYEPGEIDGTLIKTGDIRILFQAEPEIKIGDLVLVDGAKYRVLQPNPVKPADLTLCFKSQLRR
ncbi:MULTISPECIES: hypothetical protein [unclassified Erwinia]|uniref:hypothetical protein n=1 Tax=unclassified Erwinia TaxID=2622719 RepID=UPI000C178B47|nr:MULTISPECIES: hypothetical protein [unclassified Erwinia]PIJ49194.1 hypothetical protein BV501_13790 [Erwinia sp. OAMSP11]PIJ79899.1 hypothetical protein BLD47_12560 [Erwinia sp. OLCASP19]PIJ81067.1 hypothetical protein BLD46_13370 [Erwinia sp. OLMTSP26]PIJ93123.1 hypothetical protein BL249_05215 [Erwinia sp. OLFS4]